MAKCAKPTCTRREQNGGLCRQHYKLATRNKPTGLVDAKPTVEHIKKLSKAGISGKRLGQLVGMPQASIWRIQHQEQVLASTAAKILAIQPDINLAAPAAMVDSTGSGRRVQALQVLGYRTQDIADKCGVRRETIVDVPQQRFVTAELARKIAGVYEELQMTPGPNKVVRDRSLRKGWAPPMAWNEFSIEDPEAEPNLGEEGSFIDFLADAEMLGLSHVRMAEVLGITVGSLRTRIRRLAA